MGGRLVLVFMTFLVLANSKSALLTRVQKQWFSEIYTLMSNHSVFLSSGNSSCNDNLRFYVQELSNFTSWALQMYDSSTKLPDGVLSGNLIQLGDFDQCLDVVAPNDSFTGKHCIATFMQINSSISSDLNPQEMRSKNLRWSNCIPSSCSASEWQTLLNTRFSEHNIAFQAVVNDLDCHTKETDSLSARDWVAVALFTIFGLLVISSTAYDIVKRETGVKKEILLAFSLCYNGKKLLSISTGDTLHALHGIRFLSMVWIVCLHVYLVYTTAYPVYNAAYLESQLLSESRSFENGVVPLVYNSSVAVDTFFLLSGLLISYTFFKGMRNKNLSSFNIPKFYLHRYIRLTPPYAVLILLQATLFANISSAPLWDSNFQYFVNPCREYWWSALLYLQNYINPESMCLGHSWYLSVDMQLYILSPIALVLLLKKPKLGVFVLSGLVLLGVVINFVVAYVYELSPSIFLRSDLKLGQQVINYFPTHTRYPAWLIGILLGYFIVKVKGKDLLLSKKLAGFAWLCAVLLCVGSVWSIFPMMQLDYVYNVVECSFYLMLYRTVWTLGISWIIFACVSGYGGPVNTLLSWSVWQPLSKLTYSIYLIHVPMLFMRSYSSKTPVYASSINMFSDIIGNLGVTVFCAVVLTLVFEFPALTIDKYLLRRGQIKPKLKETTSEELGHVNQGFS